MNPTKIAYWLNIISYFGIIALIVAYIFLTLSTEILLILLLLICILRMISSSLKANFYQKHYEKLKEDNVFYQRRVEELLNENKDKQ
ncbi:MAG: hypothetical protein LBM25_00230 [Bacteroidales bacterium]|jgi:hypothetical protein|nr:hypothetical protein [Bacteroidales bacterium]